MNKSFLTDFVSIVIIGVSFAIPEPYRHWCLMTGLFAFSGAITNQIAIHMLFEKVPLFYGSGVIELRFESFKTSIKNLMMEQFFTKEQLDAFFANEEQKLDLTPVIEEVDITPAFEALKKTVLESSLGSMLSMFGGASMLDKFKEPFLEKLKVTIIDIAKSDDFQQKIAQNIKNSSLTNDMLSNIEQMIDARLDVLTPKMVKEIVQNFIKEHLGWLVVCGGFFGGLIGLISAMWV